MKTKETIVSEIKNATKRALDWFDAVPADKFFVRTVKTWSPSDNLDHLVRSLKSLNRVLKMPKSIVRMIFGQSNHPSRTYDEICKIYEERLAEGAQASGIYLPKQKSPDHVKKKKKELLLKFDEVSNSLLSSLKKWEDDEMDQYQLPHPLLGRLTIREMLFFSVYHTLRHARVEGD